MDVYVASCKGVQRLQAWKHLESAFLAAFFSLYAELPQCNRRGSRSYTPKLERMFKQQTINKILREFESLPRRN